MRFWPFRRRVRNVPMVPHEDRLITEDLLRRNVEDVLVIRERKVLGGVIAFRGDLTTDPARALDLLSSRFRLFGYTPFLKQEQGAVSVQAWPLAQVVERRRVALNVTLFVLTCLSTLAAGAFFFVGSPTFDAFRSMEFPLPVRFLSGVPFAAPLLAILTTHEFGHYFTARYYRASVSLPYFIPAPPPFLFGTLGAIIRMRSPARDRNSLFDIAAAGPLAGLAIALPAMWLGLEWSAVGPPTQNIVLFGDSLLRQFLVYLKFGAIPNGLVVHTHPIADAAWAGFFVTALNLFPVGQLDGGRIAYALFGERHRLVGRLTFVALLVLAAITQSANWLVWAALIFFLVGFGHQPPLDDITPLSPGRRLVGALCLVLLVVLVPPVPIPF
ncbi:MAG: site-2 protease family protein [Candidatus Rokubacteria bacterium]|nr:site-2 protease family protein [Candidatus Rokubacteria bacterium]